jgi:uncharacterized membrane protein YgaE (UPF0421/DUF939 family)
MHNVTQEPDKLGRTRDALDALHPRERVGDRVRRVRVMLWPVLQAAIAAGLAWMVATELFGHPEPFFAPIAALISVGVGLGQRLSRVLELVMGVALGVLVGDALVGVIGAGPWQIVLVVVLAMLVAVFLGGGAVIVTQAGASGVLVVTLIQPEPGQIINLDRFVDASVGGIVGIIVTAVLLPVNPVSTARRHLDPLLDTIAGLLDESARALADHDRNAASHVLAEARSTQDAVDELKHTLEGSAEIARMAPVRWRARGQLVGYLEAADPVDHITRDMRILARHVVVALRRSEPIPPSLPESLRALAGAIRLLRISLAHGDLPQEAQASALAAADMATEALDDSGGFAVQVVVAQVRSLAVDVLRAAGITRKETLALLPDLPDEDDD